MIVERSKLIFQSSDDMLCEVRFFIPPGENVIIIFIFLETKGGKEEKGRRIDRRR